MCAIKLDNNKKALVGRLIFEDEINQSSSNLPLVTIITATFNAAAYLSKTILSIRELTYKNIEWIVIDGNSTDQTVALIKKNEDVIKYWVSESDCGIYCAWNKGLVQAKGDWIAFLGAGDTYNPEAITIYIKAILASNSKPNFASSRVQLVNKDCVVLREWGSKFEWQKFQKYMNIAHVGALHHRELFEKYGLFDTKYQSSADYELLLRCGEKISSIYLGIVTTTMLNGGVSDSSKGMRETYDIQRKYMSRLTSTYRYLLGRAKRIVRPFLRGY
jgi:glycosyltransferase involved in cell wall biosynthesis